MSASDKGEESLHHEAEADADHEEVDGHEEAAGDGDAADVAEGDGAEGAAAGDGDGDEDDEFEFIGRYEEFGPNLPPAADADDAAIAAWAQSTLLAPDRVIVSYSPLHDKAVAAVAKVITDTATVKHFLIDNSPMSLTAARKLMQTLETKAGLVSIQLRFMSYVDDPAFVAEFASLVGSLITRNTTFTMLNLDYNDFGRQKFAPIAAALRGNTSLKVLRLESCNMGSDPVCDLAEALRVNTGLEAVVLMGNHFTQRGANALVDALRVNTTLRLLDWCEQQMEDCQSDDELGDDFDVDYDRELSDLCTEKGIRRH